MGVVVTVSEPLAVLVAEDSPRRRTVSSFCRFGGGLGLWLVDLVLRFCFRIQATNLLRVDGPRTVSLISSHWAVV